MPGAIESHGPFSMWKQLFQPVAEFDGEDLVTGSPEQQRRNLGQLRQTPLDGLHVGETAVALAHRYCARPGEDHVIGIRLVENVMVGARFVFGHSADRGSCGSMLRKNLVPLHKKLADQWSVPGGPRSRRRMEFADEIGEEPGVHQDHC